METATHEEAPKGTPVIEMVPCSSSQIHSFGYDTNTNTLALQFKRKDGDGNRVGGSVYHYENVSPLVYENFCAAESKGSFFGKHIKNSDLKYRKIEPAVVPPEAVTTETAAAE